MKAGRPSTGPASGAGAELSNPEWIWGLLRQHGEGLTTRQMKEYAANAGRQVHASFPFDSLQKMKQKREITKRGSGATAKYFLNAGTGVMSRQGEPQTGRQKKDVGRAKTMSASG